MADSPWAMVGRDQAAMTDSGTRAAMADRPWAMASPGPPWWVAPPKKIIGGLLPGGRSGSAEGALDSTRGGQGELDGPSGGKGELDGTSGGVQRRQR